MTTSSAQLTPDLINLLDILINYQEQEEKVCQQEMFQAVISPDAETEGRLMPAFRALHNIQEDLHVTRVARHRIVNSKEWLEQGLQVIDPRIPVEPRVGKRVTF